MAPGAGAGPRQALTRAGGEERSALGEMDGLGSNEVLTEEMLTRCH